MNTWQKYPLFLAGALALVVVCPPSGTAAGYRLFEQDTEATARGSAFVATADNPSAVYFNPAGLSQLDGFHVSAGTYEVYIDSDIETLDGKRSTQNRDRVLTVPSLFASYKLPRLPFTLGLGAYNSFGLALFYPDDSPFRDTAKKAQVIFISLSPVAAWQVTRTFSIGIGPTINYSQVLLNRGIAVPGDGFQFRGSGVAAGYEVGLRWEPLPQHAFGVTYHSSVDVNESGHTHVTVRPFAAMGNPLKVHLPEEDADADLHFPRFIVAGYSFRPTPAWNFEFDLDWTDWSSLNTPLVHQAKSGDAPVLFEWQSSFVYHFGATRTFANGLHVSAGYSYAQNSVPEVTNDGAVPDNDRNIFATGIGSRGKHWDWNVAYELIYQPTRTVHVGLPADGRYDILANSLSVSVGYHF